MTRRSNGDTKRTPTGINTNRNVLFIFVFFDSSSLISLDSDRCPNHPVVAYTPTVASPISADSSKHAATTHHHPPTSLFAPKSVLKKEC